MAFTSIAHLAQKSLTRSGVKGRVDTAIAIDRAQKVIAALLDEEVAPCIRPAYIRFRTLTLACSHSSFAACVGPFEREILEYVNAGFSKPVADRVRVILENAYTQQT